MSWEALDIQHGDVLGVYASRELATKDLAAYVQAHPEHRSEVTVAEIDDETGLRVA